MLTIKKPRWINFIDDKSYWWCWRLSLTFEVVILHRDQTLVKKLIQALLVLSLAIPFAAVGQFSRERSSLNSMEKGKWDRAKSQLQKSIRKDSVNAYAQYVFACYYFDPDNPEFHVDSAYRHSMLALNDYQLTDPKDKEKMLRLPLDSLIIVSMREQIDSAAFERATQLNTEHGYIEFLNNFPFAIQRDRAIELRNEVAYIDALKINTYQSFLSFLERYPESHRAKDARDRYNRLLYEVMTKDKKLSSYEKFLVEYPETPYRSIVEEQIFLISTAPGTATVFDDFIKKYPRSSVDRRARAILFYLLKENNESIPRSLLNDSIRNVLALEAKILVPFFSNDRFGFFDENGVDIMKPTAAEISDEYLCGNITDDILILKNLIVARNGSVLYASKFNHAVDLGNGFISVSNGQCVNIIHKSGEKIFTDCYNDSKLLDGNHLTLKNDKGWAIYSLAGKQLVKHEWDLIDREGEVIILKKGDSYSLVSLTNLNKTADQNDLKTVYACNEYRVWRGGLIWLRKGNQEALISSSLGERIPFDNHQLSTEYFGVLAKSVGGYKLFSSTFVSNEAVERVKISKPWVGVRRGGGWNLIDPTIDLHVNHQFDSLDFRGPFAMGYNSDTVRICFNVVNCMMTSIENKFRFIPGKDSVFFLLVEDGDKKNLYDQHGQRLFTVSFDRIDYYGEDLFQIQRRDKKGLLSMDGKVVAPPEFDALGRLQDSFIPVLKDKKFGLLDLQGKLIIKPMYEKNIQRYNREHLIAYKSGGYALIRSNNRAATDFEFEEIRFWNDSVALVKKNFQWLLYDFVRNQIVMEKIKDFKWVLNSEDERIIIIHQDNDYGVISSKRGTIIPATFSDLVNVGSSAQPVYFTEKHVEEASIFVVIYYDAEGKLLRRQVFELDDYERIYCSGK